MDWIAFASVVSSGGVAVSTLVVNAATKRGDRLHATSLDFEKRVWDIKSGALLDVIRTCEQIRSVINVNTDGGVERRQAAVFQLFSSVNYSLVSPELIAYASQSVNENVELLHHLMQQAWQTDAWYLEQKLRDFQRGKEDAIDQRDFDKAASIRAQEVETRKQMGRESKIPVAYVNLLCDRIIEHSRNDLRGRA